MTFTATYRSLQRGAIAALVGMSALAANAGQSNPVHFYVMGNSQFTLARADSTGQLIGLLRSDRSKGNVYQMADGSVRGFYMADSYGNAHFDIVPDLRQLNTALPAIQNQMRQALDFANKNQFFPTDKMGTWHIYYNTWTKQDNSPTGGGGQPIDLIRNIEYYRTVDGLEVCGPDSFFNVFCDANGPNGCQNNLRPLSRATFEPNLKTQSQIDREFQLEIDNMHSKFTPKVVNTRQIYYEQGLKYLVPAVDYAVQFTDPTGGKGGESFCVHILIGMSLNAPEPILHDCPERGFKPTFPNNAITETAPPGSTEMLSDNLYASLAPTPAAQASPVQVGEYIVRNDDSCWLTDAQNLWGNMNTWNLLTPWHPRVNRRDYWWDEPWCWEAALGISDNSPYFVGQDHFALMEGHGAPWLCTCLQNCCDVVHLNSSNGYGTFAHSGEKTAYITWQSCDVIPEPGHAFDGDFQSGTAWDVWWKVFKGIRAVFGYRTLMYICNGVGSYWGTYAGLGCQLTSAWLTATDHTVFHHSSGFDYGSTVLVSGHEGDTMYDNSQLSPPGSLTMWWIHA